jgi:hypothetical protein
VQGEARDALASDDDTSGHSAAQSKSSSIRHPETNRSPALTRRLYTAGLHQRVPTICRLHETTLDAVKEATKGFADNQRFVALLHDEMTIKADVVFDQR